MKKILTLIIVAILTTFSFIGNAHAATASVSVLASSNQVVIGKTFKITVKVSSGTALGAWEYTLNYDSSLVSLVSSDVSLHYAGYGDGSTKSKSYVYTFKAIKSGNASFSVSKTSVIDWNENNLTVTNGTRNVKLITQADLEATYSSNNNLSSLKVDGYEISPTFSKDVTDYTVTLPSTITKININASKEDKTANINGIGEFEVSEGSNNFKITVTAQNGNVKTYNLVVVVEDLNPIKINISNKEYTIVKRSDLISCPSTYVESSVIISENTIPSCTNEKSKYTLVGLKNEEGIVSLFIYNVDTNKYNPYIEFTLNTVIFSPMDLNEELKDYKKSTVKINGVEVECLILNDTTDFVVLYGKNIETGETGLYSYDRKENTLQRYYEDYSNQLNDDAKLYFLIMLIFGGGLLITIILTIILIVKNKKSIKSKDKENKKSNKPIKEEKNIL